MSRIQASRAAHSRLALVLLLVGALLCFGLGQVLGHPQNAQPPPFSAASQAQAAGHHVTPASGALAATPSSALSQPMPLAAPPARPTTSAGPAHHSDHAKDGHHNGSDNGSDNGSGNGSDNGSGNGSGNGPGGSKHGNGHHVNGGGHGNGGGNGGATIRVTIWMVE